MSQRAASTNKTFQRKIRLLVIGGGSILGVCDAEKAAAAPPAFANVCTGLGVSLPVLSNVAHDASGTLSGLLSPVLPALNGAIDNVNTDLTQVLSGRQIGIGVLDPSTNTFVSVPSTQCNLAVNGFAVDNSLGITIGGGQITGLGGTGNAAASAGDPTSIAFGNGSNTAAGRTNALALGTNASVSANNSVALGANSSATRGASSYTAFGLIGTQSAVGEVSVGGAGATRQLTNLAPGSAGTDAVNLNQLRGTTAQLGASVAATLGAGSAYDPVAGIISLPTFHIRGTSYTDVGSALAAVDVALSSGGGAGAFVANNTSSLPGPTASGANAAAGGFGASASGSNSVALGSGSTDGGQANVVSVGAPGAERRVINVASGQLAAGSTDAVNGGQLYQTNIQVASLQHGAVQYDRASDGSTLASVSLSSDAGGPVIIHNLAPGVAASDAATVGQVQAATSNSVQYTTVNGVKTNTIVLSGGKPGAVTISNLAPAVQGTDAVNLDQLRSYTSGMNNGANAYTDQRISNLAAITKQQIDRARSDAAGGTALALAATGLRYDDRPGKTSIGGATAYYHGQMGLAVGIGTTSENGRLRFNAALSASPTMTHPDVGGVVGASLAID